jgi:hypothetical protein
MRFKKKSHRTVHKCCRTCCYKYKITCDIPWFGLDSDGESGCYNKTDVFWWVKDDPDWYRKTRNNWKRMHRKEALEMMYERLRRDIEWNRYFENRA